MADENLTTNSVLIPAGDMPPDERFRLITATRDEAVLAARRSLGSRKLTARQLVGSDFALTPQGWAETVTATQNAYQNSAIASAAIADETFIGVYGVHVAGPDSVSGLRWTVGGRRVAQWDMQAVLADDIAIQQRENRTMFAMSPIIITQNITITIEHYVRGGSAVGIRGVELVYLGIVIEPHGRTIQP